LWSTVFDNFPVDYCNSLLGCYTVTRTHTHTAVDVNF